MKLSHQVSSRKCSQCEQPAIDVMRDGNLALATDMCADHVWRKLCAALDACPDCWDEGRPCECESANELNRLEMAQSDAMYARNRARGRH